MEQESMQLLIEDAQELQTEIVEDINEATGEKTKNYYIHGTFSTPDKKNRNGRVYSTKLWENAIAGWREKVKADNKYRLGEMEHPSRVDPDPMKAVIKITSLKLENGFVTGRAKILNDNSPTTNKMKALIDEGIKIGVSSRGTGRMKGSIVEEFNLSTYDVVQSPSDYNAMLSGIVESTEEYVYMNESTGKWVCDSKGCSLEEGTNSGDIAQTPCSKKADSLLEALQAFTKEETVLTEKEQKAMELIEGKIKVGDKLTMNDKTSFKDGKTGKVVKVGKDMAQVDFGNGDVYGITFGRIDVKKKTMTEDASDSLSEDRTESILKSFWSCATKMKQEVRRMDSGVYGKINDALGVIDDSLDSLGFDESEKDK